MRDCGGEDGFKAGAAIHVGVFDLPQENVQHAARFLDGPSPSRECVVDGYFGIVEGVEQVRVDYILKLEFRRLQRAGRISRGDVRVRF